jgi:hypothetical protein
MDSAFNAQTELFLLMRRRCKLLFTDGPLLDYDCCLNAINLISEYAEAQSVQTQKEYTDEWVNSLYHRSTFLMLSGHFWTAAQLAHRKLRGFSRRASYDPVPNTEVDNVLWQVTQ